MSHSHAVYTLPEGHLSPSTSSFGGPSYVERGPAQWELAAEDRIGPLPRGRGGRFLRRATLLVILAGGGWAWADERLPTLPPWMKAEVSSLATTLGHSVRAALAKHFPAAQTGETAPGQSSGQDAAQTAPSVSSDMARSAASAPPLPPLPPPQGPTPVRKTDAQKTEATKAEIAFAAVLPAAPSQVLTTGGLPAASATPAKSPVASVAQAYTPAAPPNSDPLQKRAETAGLHRDTSRALLERLSAVDYRNAAAAVRTALARPSESGVLVWPRQRGPGEAVFEVRFVSGAAPECRRYVVTVLKDRWATTAPPVDACGVLRQPPVSPQPKGAPASPARTG